MAIRNRYELIPQQRTPPPGAERPTQVKLGTRNIAAPGGRNHGAQYTNNNHQYSNKDQATTKKKTKNKRVPPCKYNPYKPGPTI